MSGGRPKLRRRLWLLLLPLLLLLVASGWWTMRWVARREARRMHESMAAGRGDLVAWVAIDDGRVMVIRREGEADTWVSLRHQAHGTVWAHRVAGSPSGEQEALRVVAGIATVRTERDGSNLQLWAWRVDDGEPAWPTGSVALPGRTLPKAPQRLDDGSLLYEIVDDAGPAVVVLDSFTGKVRWRTPLPPIRIAEARAGRMLVQEAETYAWHVVGAAGVKPTLDPSVRSTWRLGDRLLFLQGSALVSTALDGQDRRTLIAKISEVMDQSPAEGPFLYSCMAHEQLLIFALEWAEVFALMAVDRASHALVWRLKLGPSHGWGGLPEGEVGRHALISLAERRGGGMSIPGRRQLAAVDLKEGAVMWRRGTTHRSFSSEAFRGRFTYLKWRDRALMAFDTDAGELVAAVRAPPVQTGVMGDPYPHMGWKRFVLPKQERLRPEHRSDERLWIAADGRPLALDGRTLQPLPGQEQEPLEDLMPRLDELLPPETSPGE